MSEPTPTTEPRPKNEAQLELRWSCGDEPLSPEQVGTLLSSKEFGDKLVESIQNMENAEGDLEDLSKNSKEYGYVGFRELGTSNKSFVLSPVFEGEETGIALGQFSNQFRDENPDLFGMESFHLHTHPTYSTDWMLAQLNQSIFAPQKKPLSQGHFSEGDLKSLKYLSREEDSSTIYALATRDLGSATQGRLLLVSFGDFQSYKDFNPEEVYKKSKEYIKADRDPTDAYREAGLNVSILDVDLHSVSPLKQEQIMKASQTLTTRRLPQPKPVLARLM